MFQFPESRPIYLFYSVYSTHTFMCGFPHSEISGSLAIYAYPELIAAYRVLLRLLVPRHSPCALCSLIFFFSLQLFIALLYCFILSLIKDSLLCAVFKELLSIIFLNDPSKLNR